MVTHSSVPVWRIPETGEPGGLTSVGSHRVGLKWLSSSSNTNKNWKESTLIFIGFRWWIIFCWWGEDPLEVPNMQGTIYLWISSIKTPHSSIFTFGPASSDISVLQLSGETVSHSVVFDSLQPHGLYGLPGFSVCGIFQARILEWVANFLLLGTFSIQGLNLGLLHCRQILYCLSHQGNPKYLVLKAYLFIHMAIHLVSKHLLNTFYRQRTVLGLGNPVWRWCCPHARGSLQPPKFQGG